MACIYSFNNISKKEKNNSIKVSDFINQGSPDKASKTRSLDYMDDASIGSNLDNDKDVVNVTSKKIVSWPPYLIVNIMLYDIVVKFYCLCQSNKMMGQPDSNNLADGWDYIIVDQAILNES